MNPTAAARSQFCTTTSKGTSQMGDLLNGCTTTALASTWTRSVAAASRGMLLTAEGGAEEDAPPRVLGADTGSNGG